jgi:hypothetical protein
LCSRLCCFKVYLHSPTLIVNLCRMAWICSMIKGFILYLCVMLYGFLLMCRTV